MEKLFEIEDTFGDRLCFGVFPGNKHRIHFSVVEVFKGPCPGLETDDQSQEVMLELDQAESFAKAVLAEVDRLRGDVPPVEPKPLTPEFQIGDTVRILGGHVRYKICSFNDKDFPEINASLRSGCTGCWAPVSKLRKWDK